jgi:MYXO-CTERM domain-containing protein
VLNNRFVSNDSYSGAALAWRFAVPEEGEPVLSEETATLGIVNNTFVANDVPWGSIGLWWGHEAEVVNNIVTGSAVGVGVYTEDTSVTGGYNLWWNLEEKARGTEVVPGEHAVYDTPMFQEADPRDCDAVHWLHVLSPARNAGDPTVLNVDGRRSDIGAWGGPYSGLEDPDGDTWLEDGDCDEVDTGINPGTDEVWYDGTDQDCDGNDLDQDWDTFDHEDYGGDDCDDTDSAVWPGASDTPNDDVDQDCDGVDSKSWLEGSGGCGCATAGGTGGGVAFLVASLLVGWRRREWMR